MMRKKRAQSAGQVFIYVLTLIIVSVILIYGYNSIIDTRNKSEKIFQVKLQSDMKNLVDSLSSDFGSVKIRTIDVGHFRQACFTETYDPPADRNIFGPPPKLQNIDPIIQDSFKSRTEENLFFIGDTVENSFYIGNISVSPDVFCVNVTNAKITIQLEGKGDHVEISQP